MSLLQVWLLGRFEMTLDGESILDALGNSKKKASLLQYLLINKDNPFTNQDLFVHLWGDDDSANPASGLNTLVSRLRKDLKPYELSDIITLQNDVYQWNPEYDQVDIELFDAQANRLLPLSGLDARIKEEFEETLGLYKGDLLASYDTGGWIVPRSMYYHNLYLKLAHTYIALLKEANAFEDILRVARRGLEIDPYDSRLNLELVNAMLALDMKLEAMNHYNYTVSAHHMQRESILRRTCWNSTRRRSRQNTPRRLFWMPSSRDLARDDGDKTALVCDYAIFKDIYNINMRNLQRLGITMFLGVLTLTKTSESQTDSEAILLDRIMGMLQATLKFNLRKGDTISRYGPSQFLVLLPTKNLSSGALALERVKNASTRTARSQITYSLTNSPPSDIKPAGEDPGRRGLSSMLINNEKDPGLVRDLFILR